MDDNEELEESEIVVKSCNLSDDYLKKISELFGNSNGRDIIMLLVDKEMYVNEISIKLDLRVSLVVYHLKKLGELGFLTITNKPISKKTKNHKFYKINIHAFAIILHKKDEEGDKNILKQIFKDTVKFASIGLAAIFSYFTTIKKTVIDTDTNFSSDVMVTNESQSVIFALIVIIVGILILYLLEKRKKRRY